MRSRSNIRKGICLFVALFALSTSSAQAALEEWSIFSVSAPISLETKLGAVSCFSSKTCVTVGHYQTFNFPPGKKHPLAGKWDEEVTGEEFETELPPTIAEADATLTGVSCTAATTCMAVGSSKKNLEGSKALAQQRTESGWKNQLPANPGGALETKLEAVSCTASNACTAVGYYKNSSEEIVPLAERWNGEKWTIQTTSPPEGESEEAILTGVSCSSSTVCTAVGRYNDEGTVRPLAERWNSEEKEEWSLQLAPMPEGALEAKLEDVSCIAPSWCTAVGSYENSSGVKLTLAEHWEEWSGWQIQSTPNPEGAEEASFSGVSCVSKVCMATGSYEASSVRKTLAERYSAGSWKLSSPENPEEAENPVLAAASCTSVVFCMTVGSSWTGWYKPLAERYIHAKVPVNTVKPSISPSTPETGKAATATTGTWTEEPSFYEYQWKRCNASGLECANILGATASTYYPLAADVDKTLVVEVKAYNEAGNGSASSAASGKVKKAGVITEYATGSPWSGPQGITPGPDENLWFTLRDINKIGKITTAGSITEYSAGTGSGSQPTAITKGPDGNLWFSFELPSSRVAKTTTSGTVTKYELSKTMNNGRDITKGPDGNLWFTATEGRVGKITTSGTFTSYEVSGEPTGIATGPDENLWLTKYGADKVSKMTTGGTVTDYSLSTAQDPYGIASGPETKVWFGASGKIGKINTSTGAIVEYSLPAAGEVKGITEGPDGLVWFAHYGADKIGKITAGGTVTEYSLPPGSKPWDVAAGSDGNVWFTLSGSNRIGMIEP